MNKINPKQNYQKRTHQRPFGRQGQNKFRQNQSIWDHVDGDENIEDILDQATLRQKRGEPLQDKEQRMPSTANNAQQDAAQQPQPYATAPSQASQILFDPIQSFHNNMQESYTQQVQLRPQGGVGFPTIYHGPSLHFDTLGLLEKDYEYSWFYKDSKGVQRGPFKQKTMAKWYNQGQLPLDLPIMLAGVDQKFTQLNIRWQDVMQRGQSPFSVAPPTGAF